MKAIMISIKPEWVAKILNGKKTIEIRKKFPKDYRGWVYIYCTKGKEKLCYVDYSPIGNKGYLTTKLDCEGSELNGKVVARFWCDKVEEIDVRLGHPEIYVGACVDDLWCLDNGYHDKNYMVRAIHISDLEIFDKPKELNEFIKCDNSHIRIGNCFIGFGGIPRLTKAPQSWCYIHI